MNHTEKTFIKIYVLQVVKEKEIILKDINVHF